MTTGAGVHDLIPFRFSIDDDQDMDLRVLSFSAEEALFESFTYIIDLASPDPDLAIDEYVGRQATFVLYGEDGEEVQRRCSGIIAYFQQGETGHQFTLYRAYLVPELKRLHYRQDCRIFQDLSVDKIIEQVLQGAGISRQGYTIALSKPRQARVYCVQYRESDLNFIARLMEDEGILYFFEHTEEGSQLVITDDPSRHPALPLADNILYHTKEGGVADEEHIHSVKWSENLTTNKVTLRDYDFKQPTLPRMEKAASAVQSIEFEQYDYPGLYEQPDNTGALRTQVRLDGLQASRRSIEGKTAIRRLQPGYQFTLTDHPSERFNRRYVITRVTQQGDSPQNLEAHGGGDGHYHATFVAIPAEVIFVPPRHSHRPAIDGVQTAIVVGPSGEEIYTDEHGRVKVQFHWDRQGKSNEKSSCWIRVSQAWAGASWGSMHIPRIGQEVIVSFEEGDPDRPLITGRTYHGDNQPPFPLPASKAQSGIKSNSTMGGNGSNEFIFDDTKGNENITLHAEHNNTISVENNENHSVAVDRSKSVGANETVSIGVDRTETVGNNETISIGVNRMETVGANETISIAANRTETVGANEVSTIKGNRTETVFLNETVTVMQNRTETTLLNETLSTGVMRKRTVGLNETVYVKGKQDLTVDKNQTVTVKDNQIVTVEKDRSRNTQGNERITISGECTETMGKSRATQITDNDSTQVGKAVSLVAGDSISIVTGAASLTMKSDGTINLSGVTLTVNGEDFTCTMSNQANVAAKDVAVDGSNRVAITGTSEASFGGDNVIVSGGATTNMNGDKVDIAGGGKLTMSSSDTDIS